MNLDFITDYEFFLSLGSVTVGASLVTLVVTEIIKAILKKRRVITAETDESRRDSILAAVGRSVALVAYTGLYIANEFLLSRSVVLDGELLAGLFSGAALTLAVSKGIYTALHQHRNKKTVYEKLRRAEETIAALGETGTPVKASDKDRKWALRQGGDESDGL